MTLKSKTENPENCQSTKIVYLKILYLYGIKNSKVAYNNSTVTTILGNIVVLCINIVVSK